MNGSARVGRAVEEKGKTSNFVTQERLCYIETCRVIPKTFARSLGAPFPPPKMDGHVDPEEERVRTRRDYFLE